MSCYNSYMQHPRPEKERYRDRQPSDPLQQQQQGCLSFLLSACFFALSLTSSSYFSYFSCFSLLLLLRHIFRNVTLYSTVLDLM
ncbi:GL11306 [Drosophila persimilis]|uniref:GL11306 n=1 Tax=Drosophila persimilis TaxID=7234 RepID=B4GA39_DROPE|nr:GL11306 [Drosophila persimilis]